jgi:cystathionine gamma-synthase/methionine-gamma-lyase
MTHDTEGLHPETLAISFGHDPQTAFGAAKPPVYLTTTFVYPSAEHAKKVHESYFDGAPPPEGSTFIYARLNHPNLDSVERRLAVLDRAEDAAVFSSGMAAVSALMFNYLRPGDALVHSRPLYGGVDALVHTQLQGFGVRPFGVADAVSESAWREAFEAAAREGPIGLVLLETPANPTATVADIALVARLARDYADPATGRRPLVIVDNTFLGPFVQTPLEHGADFTLTALTKYCAGHSDLLAGGVSGSAAAVGPLKKIRMVLGTHLDPFSSWLLLRSFETLALRSARAGENAVKIAAFLKGHEKIERVTYLGFIPEGAPARAVLERQARSHGSTFCFTVKGGEAEAFRMLNRLKVLRLAVSLGGAETLICHPATTTHYATPRARREEVGITDGTVRVSVGIEHPDDLLRDLAQALEAV